MTTGKAIKDRFHGLKCRYDCAYAITEHCNCKVCHGAHHMSGYEQHNQERLLKERSSLVFQTITPVEKLAAKRPRVVSANVGANVGARRTA